MIPGKFTPKDGNRNRAILDSALRIYEQSMDHYLGFGKPVEASKILTVLRSTAGCNQKQLRLAKLVVEARNNAAHFAGPAFAQEYTLKGVHSIAETLDSFSLNQSADRVRELISTSNLRKTSTRGMPYQLTTGRLALLCGAAGFLLVYMILNGLGVEENAGSWSLVTGLIVGAAVGLKLSRRGRR